MRSITTRCYSFCCARHLLTDVSEPAHEWTERDETSSHDAKTGLDVGRDSDTGGGIEEVWMVIVPEIGETDYDGSTGSRTQSL